MGQARTSASDLDRSLADAAAGGGDQVGDHAVEHGLERLVEFQLLAHLGVARFRLLVQTVEHGHAGADVVELQNVRLVAIIEVGGVVGDLVGQVDELRLQRRTLVEQVLGKLGEFPRAVIRECLMMPSRTSKVRFRPRKAA